MPAVCRRWAWTGAWQDVAQDRRRMTRRPTRTEPTMTDDRATALIARLDAAETRLAALAAEPLPDGETEPSPGGEETWTASQVWGHLSEFPAYWTASARRVLAAPPDAPAAFGRTTTDLACGAHRGSGGRAGVGAVPPVCRRASRRRARSSASCPGPTGTASASTWSGRHPGARHHGLRWSPTTSRSTPRSWSASPRQG